MKKLLTLALAVLGFTVAQAVTIAWDYNPNNTYSDATYQDDANTTDHVEVVNNKPIVTPNTGGNNTQACESASFAAILTIKNDTSAVETMKFGAWRAGNIILQTTDTGKMQFTWNKTATHTSTAVDTPEQQFLIAMTFDANQETDVTTAKGYINGVEAFSAIFENVPNNAAMNGINMYLYESDEIFTIDEAVAYKGVLTDAEIAAMSSAKTANVNNVPEPTVLALLALGVAGVALKRKKVVA